MWTNAKVVGEGCARIQPTHARGDAARSMSRSDLVEFYVCPAKWVAKKDEEKQTDAMTLGTVLDTILTQPDKLEEIVAVHPATYINSNGIESAWDYRSNNRKKWRNEQLEAGKLPISPDTMESARKAVAAVLANPDTASLLKCSRKQVLITADWQDKTTGLKIPFSGLLDLVPDVGDERWGKVLADIKTARNGDPAKWATVCDNEGYDVQAAIYMDIYTSATGEDRTDFTHLVVENTDPFHVVSPMPSMSSEFLAWGRAKYTRAVKLYCECLKSGEWPSYPVFGMPHKGLQIIGPDSLWAYRNNVGARQLVAPPDETKEDDRIDILN